MSAKKTIKPTETPSKIGLKIAEPKNSCDDINCPFHGNLRVHGQTFTGIVKKMSGTKTIQLEFKRLYPLTKFERFEKRRTRLQVHNPPCINAKIGDKVTVIACRPLSKTKNFVIIKNEGVLK